MHDFLTLKSKEMEVGGAPEVISVLPLGHVKSAKGEFDVDGESFAAMKAQIAQRGVDLVVDYEHQTLTGEQAPAAGWVKELFLSDGQIKARVEWTDRAKAYLENREYRYLSPVITVRKADNKATGLHSIALTNTPAIEHMEAIVNSLDYEEGGQNTMNEFMKKLAALLGLGEDATEEQVAEALKGSNIALGAQNCAAEEKGAYTGEVSAAMIAALGCRYVILGHSERRQYYGETSETLNLKMARAYAHGLTPVYCVGENLEEREAGKHFDVVKAQIEEVVCNLTPEQFAGLVIAYEPVWAIGTGKTATADQAQEIHAFIRKVLADKFGAAAAETPILYGGSCKPSNAAELFAKEDVDGGLIGGAALKAEDFLGIGQGFAK